VKIHAPVFLNVKTVSVLTIAEVGEQFVGVLYLMITTPDPPTPRPLAISDAPPPRFTAGAVLKVPAPDLAVPEVVPL
jgi:hypothetical protein